MDGYENEECGKRLSGLAVWTLVRANRTRQNAVRIRVGCRVQSDCWISQLTPFRPARRFTLQKAVESRFCPRGSVPGFKAKVDRLDGPYICNDSGHRPQNVYYHIIQLSCIPTVPCLPLDISLSISSCDLPRADRSSNQKVPSGIV